MYVNIESNESNVKRKHLSSYVHFIPPSIPCLFRFSKLQGPGKNINSGKNYDVTENFIKSVHDRGKEGIGMHQFQPYTVG